MLRHTPNRPRRRLTRFTAQILKNSMEKHGGRRGVSIPSAAVRSVTLGAALLAASAPSVSGQVLWLNPAGGRYR